VDSLDIEIAAILNADRPADRLLKSAPQVHQEKVFGIIGNKPDLAAELAKVQFAPIDLAEAIKQVGHKVTKVTSTHISVLFPGRKRPNRYNIAELLQKIATLAYSGGGKRPPRRKTQDIPPP
jgi:hypothetical protein